MISDLPHCVYRLFDAEGALLYVGMAVNADRRLEQHHGKTWWPQVVRHTLTAYPDRPAAESAEREAIQIEDPAHNIIHSKVNPRKKRERTGLYGSPLVTGVLVETETWTGKQCAEAWGIRPSTWRDYVAKGYAPSHQPGYDDDRQRRWDAEIVRNYKRPGQGRRRTDLSSSTPTDKEN